MKRLLVVDDVPLFRAGLASALRDAGFEVIYTGLRQTPDMIVRDAIQEDVDAIGLSVHSGAHLTLFRKVMEILKAEGAEHILVTGGGIIPEDDIPQLEENVEIARSFNPMNEQQLAELEDRAEPVHKQVLFYRNWKG